MWWIVWSPTEQMTYQAYALPRVQALSGRAWVAIAVVAFWWALEHSFISLILGWRYVAWRSLAFLPGVTVFTLIHIRTAHAVLPSPDRVGRTVTHAWQFSTAC